MTRRSLLGSLAGCAAAGAATLPAAQRPASTAPWNIVLILLDDLGWRDFGCYGNTFHETPAVDQVAKDGALFTRSYAACPVCSPTRASILTGKYPARLKVTDWIPGRKQWPTAKLNTPAFNQQLPLAETTIAEMLAPKGYRSASVGKWHLGGTGYLPEQQGFALNVSGDHRGGVRKFFGPLEVGNLNLAEGESLTDRLTSEAEKFIEASKDQPFFVYLSHYTPHLPLDAKPDVVDKYKRKGGTPDKNNPIYAAMIESVDDCVRRVRAKLQQTGVADRTVVIVTSDNGGLRFEGRSPRPTTDNAPLRAGKGHLYEGGIRNPLLVYWPGVTKAGQKIDTLVSTIDLLPTIAEIAGTATPRQVDGVSLVPLLRGNNGRLRRDALYWHYPHYSNQGGVPGGAMREGNWKLIEFYEDSRLELFDLSKDPAEQHNLAMRESKRAAAMQKRLAAWRTSVSASMPTVNPGYDPAKADQGLTGAEKPTPPE
jgi:arylsulfatase A-like enzyme